MSKKLQRNELICACSLEVDDDAKSLACSCCSRWYHFKCLEILGESKTKLDEAYTEEDVPYHCGLCFFCFKCDKRVDGTTRKWNKTEKRYQCKASCLA